MIDLGPHAGFILGAYSGVALTVLALIAVAAVSARRVRARLAALEAARPERGA